MGRLSSRTSRAGRGVRGLSLAVLSLAGGPGRARRALDLPDPPRFTRQAAGPPSRPRFRETPIAPKRAGRSSVEDRLLGAGKFQVLIKETQYDAL